MYLNLLRETGQPCRLIVIDPAKCFLDAANGRDDAKLRATMEKLTDLANRSGTAILLIATPSKVEKGKRGNEITLCLIRPGGYASHINLNRDFVQ